MFTMEHVVQSFPLLEEVEKEQPCFTSQQKEDFYRIAFHKDSFQEVEAILLQMTAPHMTKEKKDQILAYHLEQLPSISENMLQIESYIFKMCHMTYEKEKANQMLMDILKRDNIEYDLEAMIEQSKAEIGRMEAARSEKRL